MWLQWVQQKVNHPDELPDSTIVVIGLWNMGYTDMKTVGRLLGLVDLRPLRRLAKMLKTSEDPVIRRCVDVGLPPGVYRQLPGMNGPPVEPHRRKTRGVLCKLCGRTVDCVPCPRCSMVSPRTEEIKGGNGKLKSTSPMYTTDANPGSLRKLTILRHRLERGEELFHPEDKAIEIAPVEMIPVDRDIGVTWDDTGRQLRKFYGDDNLRADNDSRADNE
jgi:hypothetical protein